MKSTFIFLTLILFACGTSKGNNTGQDESKTTGKIFLGDACVYINATVDGKPISMYPINLEEQFKVSDLKISFDFSPSRAPQPTDCVVDRVVTVSNVFIVK
ncbi:MAG TPA: hypothetical protein EYG86_00385 [Crocinitomicaceae bacterium]|nr:hypothetical protein [Crocinitomicaceae bacterium]